MRIGLLADTHDRVPAIREFMEQFTAREVRVVLHAGDFCAPFALEPILDTHLPLVGVYGRSDGDREGLQGTAARGLAVELYSSPHSFELGGRRILLVHQLSDAPERSLNASDIVVHGSLHRQEMRYRDQTLFVCPGEGCGWLHGEPGAAVLDLDSRDVEFLKLTGPEWKF
jgi:uncharacterized protein